MNNAIMATIAVGQPVLIDSKTDDDYTQRVPPFWGRSTGWRRTPVDKGLGTYGIRDPARYAVRHATHNTHTPHSACYRIV